MERKYKQTDSVKLELSSVFNTSYKPQIILKFAPWVSEYTIEMAFLQQINQCLRFLITKEYKNKNKKNMKVWIDVYIYWSIKLNLHFANIPIWCIYIIYIYKVSSHLFSNLKNSHLHLLKWSNYYKV